MANKNEKRMLASFLLLVVGIFVIKVAVDKARSWLEYQYRYYESYGYRIINTDGKVVSDSCYFNISDFNSNGVAIQFGKRSPEADINDSSLYTENGFVDYQGNEVYEEASKKIRELNLGYGSEPQNYIFSDQIFAFHDEHEGKIYIIELETGDEYIVENAGCSSMLSFTMSEGLIGLMDYSSGKCGYIDEYGKWVIEPQYEWAYEFSDGLANVEIDDKKGYIDHQGNVVIEPQYHYAYPFSEGLAAVAYEDKLMGYIDKNGKTVLEPKYFYARSFCDGLACVRESNDKNSKYGFINKQGELVIDYQFDDAGDFHYGRAWVRIDDGDCRKYGYIDTSGQMVIPCELDYASDFTADGFALADKDGYGYIDKDGNWLIEPQLSSGSRLFNNGYAKVLLETGQRISYDMTDAAQWKKDYNKRTLLLASVYFFYMYRMKIITVLAVLYLIFFAVIVFKYYKSEWRERFV